MKYNISFILLLLIWSCIGTDVVDDELVPEEVLIEPGDTSVLINSEIQFSATYWNEFGLQEEVDIVYLSLDGTVLTIQENGLARAVSSGQSTVVAVANGINSEGVIVNVLGSVEDIGRIEITSENNAMTVPVGSMLQLNATAFNFLGEEIPMTTFSWQSTDESIASVDENGLVTGIGDGNVEITAISGGTSSTPFTLVVGSPQRTGVFSGRSGYFATGTTALFMNDDGEIVLELGQDFETEFALGTFIYLSNSESGSSTRANGLELSEISSNGFHSFNVTQAAARTGESVTFDQYQFVIVLCKPASITFGAAELN
jgi:hypothetical protein